MIMKYIIPQEEADLINESFPVWWIFCSWDNIFDPLSISFYNFDYETIFQNLFGKSFQLYLSEKEIIDKPYMIYDYISNPTTENHICPKDQSFNTLWWLRSKLIRINWIIDKIEWYWIDSNWEYTKLCVIEDYSYEMYFSDYIKNIVVDITWYHSDWTPWESIQDKTQLEIWDSSMFWKDARTRVIERLKPKVIELLIYGWYTEEEAKIMWFQVFLLYWSEVQSYIEWLKTPLIDSILNDSNISWLSKEINWVKPRDLIISNIDF